MPTAKPSDAVPAAVHAAFARALRALDPVLGLAVEQQARLLGTDSLIDPWRGMHLELADVRRLLASAAPDPAAMLAAPGVVGLLADAMHEVMEAAAVPAGMRLVPLDLALCLIAAAPDLDLRYERIYGYLQDDLTRKRPAIDLMANLLAATTEERLALAARFEADASLRRHGVMEPSGDNTQPWLARGWRLDALWLNRLVGRAEPDASLAGCARLVTPSAAGLNDSLAEPDVLDALRRAQASPPLRLVLHGPHGAGKYDVALALAHELGSALLVVDVRGWADAAEVRAQIQRVHRGAALFGWLPYLHGVQALMQGEPQRLRSLLDALAEEPSLGFVLAMAAVWPQAHAAALSATRIELGFPSAERRPRLWRRAVAARGVVADDGALTQAALRFRLSAAQIDQAAADLAVAAAAPPLGYAELAAAARAQSGADLALLARRVVPRADFSALVTVPEVKTQLREICERVATREAVRRDWSGASVHGRALGVTALFVGASGTGKTLAAEALACELGLDLYRIDLAGIVSKYIGETEKNLDRVFAAAENANAVLFFDEADALFGKRSEVKDAHDRYANIEVAYLLQKMEQLDGLAILATNLKQNLDEAFARRLTFTLNFPFPEALERERLWECLWPPRAPRAADVDLGWFAREFRLSGGNIRNTVMAAAHLAASDGQVITREHLLHATRREYQKLGKNLVTPAAGDARRAA